MRVAFQSQAIVCDDEQFLVDTYTLDDLDNILSNETLASPWPWSRENFASSLNNNQWCIGVKVEQDWIAHSVFSLAADEAELLILAVLPSFQRRGVAAQLLAVVEKDLANYARELYLEVRASNHGAIGFYESQGFNCVGERPQYYPSKKGRREHALIYAKAL